MGIRNIKQERKRKYLASNIWWGYVMISPLMIGLLIFSIWPLVQTIYLSFTSWGDFGNYTWNGISNYKKLFSDVQIFDAFRNTLLYIVISTPSSVILSIIVAVLLNQKIGGVALYRVLYFLPVITMPTAIAMVWKWLYNSDNGLFNYFLSLLSIKGVDWLSDTRTALYSVIVVSIWSSIGYNMVIFLAGLQGIPTVYYEAASIDGAGPLKTFVRITIPLLTPTIFFVTVISIIEGFQVFDYIYVMLGNNPITRDSAQTVVYLFYKEAFRYNNKGYASAIVILLMIIILFVTAVQMRLQKKWVNY